MGRACQLRTIGGFVVFVSKAQNERIETWYSLALIASSLKPGERTNSTAITHPLGCQDCHFAHTHTRGPWHGAAEYSAKYSDTGDLADPGIGIGELRALAGRQWRPDRVHAHGWPYTAAMRSGSLMSDEPMVVRCISLVPS